MTDSSIKRESIKLSRERLMPKINWAARAKEAEATLPAKIIWQCVYCKTIYFVEDRCPTCGARDGIGRKANEYK